MYQNSKFDTSMLSSNNSIRHTKIPGNVVTNAMNVTNLFDKYAILKVIWESTLERNYMAKASIIWISWDNSINISK